MQMKNNIQSLIAQQITQWLTDPSMRVFLKRDKKKTLAETNFDLLIRWYPQVASDGTDSYSLDILGRLKNASISMEAKNCLLQILSSSQTNLKELKVAMKKAIHYEHNCPVDVMKQRLLKLDPSILNQTKVEEVLNDAYAIVLISKEEEAQLRQMKLSKTGDFHERLNAIGAQLISDSEKQILIQKITDELAN